MRPNLNQLNKDVMSSARQKEMLTEKMDNEKDNVFDSINRIDLPFSTYFN